MSVRVFVCQCMCQCVYVSVYVSVCVSECVYVSASECVSVCVIVSLYLGTLLLGHFSCVLSWVSSFSVCIFASFKI